MALFLSGEDISKIVALLNKEQSAWNQTLAAQLKGISELKPLLNELGAAVGRIEAEQKNTFPKFLFLDGRISELIDNIKSRVDMANNAIVALSGRLATIEEQLKREWFYREAEAASKETLDGKLESIHGEIALLVKLGQWKQRKAKKGKGKRK